MNYDKVIKYSSLPHIDERGILAVITDKIIKDNFVIKNVFYVKITKEGIIRGEHAHYKTNEILFNISGKLEVGYYNKNINGQTILNENEGLLIPSLTWISIKNLIDNSIYLVLMDKEYDEDDNIRNKNKFMELISNDS